MLSLPQSRTPCHTVALTVALTVAVATEVAVATPSMLLDHLRTTMADNFHPSRDVVEVPLEVVLRDILTHTHQSV